MVLRIGVRACLQRKQYEVAQKTTRTFGVFNAHCHTLIEDID
jgi:hypothetical protein